MKQAFFDEGAGWMRRWLFFAAMLVALLDTSARLVARLAGIPHLNWGDLAGPPLMAVGRAVLSGAIVAIIGVELFRRSKFARARSWDDRRRALALGVALGVGFAVCVTALNHIARPKLLFKNAWSLAHQANYDGALRELDRLLREYPRHVDGYLERAWVRGRLRDYPGSVADATRAIELDGRNASAYYRRGWARSALQEYEGAIADLTQSIERDPDKVAAYVERAFARGRAGHYDGAIADATTAIRLDPTAATAYNNRGFARAATDDLEGAISDFSRVLELQPNEANAYLRRGRARYRLGDLRGAVRDWEAASQLDPDVRREVETELAQARAKLASG